MTERANTPVTEAAKLQIASAAVILAALLSPDTVSAQEGMCYCSRGGHVTGMVPCSWGTCAPVGNGTFSVNRPGISQAQPPPFPSTDNTPESLNKIAGNFGEIAKTIAGDECLITIVGLAAFGYTGWQILNWFMKKSS